MNEVKAYTIFVSQVEGTIFTKFFVFKGLDLRGLAGVSHPFKYLVIYSLYT